MWARVIDSIRRLARRRRPAPADASGPTGTGWLRGRGVEIGAHLHPIPGIEPIYVDRFLEFAGGACPADVLARADALPFRDGTLDYVASSHLIEHLADPVKGLLDWCRALRPGGILYLVVPDARYTFDHRRARTTPEHMLEDHRRGAPPSDRTHLADWVRRVDVDKLRPDLDAAGREAFRHEMAAWLENPAAAGAEVNIHFHVFEPETFLALVETLRMTDGLAFPCSVVETREWYPPDRGLGFLVVLQKETAGGASPARDG